MSNDMLRRIYKTICGMNEIKFVIARSYNKHFFFIISTIAYHSKLFNITFNWVI